MRRLTCVVLLRLALLWLALVVLAPTSLATAQAATDPDAVALLYRMVEAEMNLQVVGQVEERIALPGVAPDPLRRTFALPVGITPGLVIDAFSLSLGPATEVAGRQVAALVLEGRGPLTPDWTFWIDSTTGVRLAYRLSDSAGEVVAAGRYERIRRIDTRSTPRVLPSPTRGDDSGALARLLDPLLVPEGYVAVSIQRATLGRADVPALRLTYWDGLDALVVLIYQRQPNLPEATANLSSRHVGRFSVSVIGAAPQRALASWLDRVSDGPLARLDPSRTLQASDQPTGERQETDRQSSERRSTDREEDRR